MGKSVMSIARELEKQRPVYKAMRKVMRWYEENTTPPELASKISMLHDLAESKRIRFDEQCARELTPLLQQINTIKEQAQAMGAKHKKEKEDIATGFAQAELDLLQGKITELPDEIASVDARPSGAWHFFNNLGKIVDALIVPPQRWLRKLSTAKASGQDDEDVVE